MRRVSRWLTTTFATLFLLGCATYTSQQTRQCVQASVSAARADIASIRACVEAGSPEPARGALDQCIANSADAALADAEAVLACMPDGPITDRAGKP